MHCIACGTPQDHTCEACGWPLSDSQKDLCDACALELAEVDAEMAARRFERMKEELNESR